MKYPKVIIDYPGHKLHGKEGRVFHDYGDGRVNAQVAKSPKKGDFVNLSLKKGEYTFKEEEES